MACQGDLNVVSALFCENCAPFFPKKRAAQIKKISSICKKCRNSLQEAVRLSPSAQLIRDSAGNRTGAGASQARIDDLKASDEIEHFIPRVGTSRHGAKVGTAAEGPVLINRAGAVLAQKRASTVRALRQRFAARRAHRPGGQQRFAAGELRRAAGQPELAAFGQPRARARDGAVLQFPVNGAHLFQRGVLWRFRRGSTARSHNVSMARQGVGAKLHAFTPPGRRRVPRPRPIGNYSRRASQ
jgi:hypothetical protein